MLMKKENLMKILIYSFIFIGPFIFMETMWITRNFVKTKKIIPLQEISGNSSFDIMKPTTDIFNSCGNFCRSFGGDWIRWNPSSAMSWFSTEEYLNHMNFERPGIEVFPKHIQHDKEKINKLKQARKAWWKSTDKLATKIEKVNATNEAIHIFNTLKQDIYINHPFLFHVKARFIYSFNLLYESSTYYFPYTFAEGNIFEKLIKIMAKSFIILYLLFHLYSSHFILLNIEI